MEIIKKDSIELTEKDITSLADWQKQLVQKNGFSLMLIVKSLHWFKKLESEVLKNETI